MLTCAYRRPTWRSARAQRWHQTAKTAASNCQSANAGFPLAMMETNCASPFGGVGVETDWMRVFWDVHTRGSDEPTMNDVLRWMAAADDDEAAPACGLWYRAPCIIRTPHEWR